MAEARSVRGRHRRRRRPGHCLRWPRRETSAAVTAADPETAAGSRMLKLAPMKTDQLWSGS